MSVNVRDERLVAPRHCRRRARAGANTYIPVATYSGAA